MLGMVRFARVCYAATRFWYIKMGTNFPKFTDPLTSQHDQFGHRELGSQFTAGAHGADPKRQMVYSGITKVVIYEWFLTSRVFTDSFACKF